VANHHYAALGDVWKHLPLAELLRIDPPRHYWETHAGSASYPLTPSAGRNHGALRFLSVANSDAQLSGSAYLETLRGMPGVYPGSSMLAMTLLEKTAKYILCDLHPHSVQSLRDAGCRFDARVVQDDGMAVIAAEMQQGQHNPADVLAVVDPFEAHERLAPESPTPVDLAIALANRGYRLFYWYGYDQLDQRGWALKTIASQTRGVNLWCGDLLIPSPFVYVGRTGTWGCGIVLANMNVEVMQACARLGHALERAYADDLAADNEPPRISFRVMT
jgi:23S rRNA A2030 N6-methylase RlmJ